MGFSAPMGWIKLDLILRRLSCWSLVPAALTVYTIIAMSHSVLRHSPTWPTQPLCRSAELRQKIQFLESQVLPGHREVHWQSPCEKRQKFVRSKVRQHIWANITQCAEAIKLSGGSMNSSLSGDEKTAPWRHQTLGTGPLTVTSGPWPSFPTVTLVS